MEFLRAFFRYLPTPYVLLTTYLFVKRDEIWHPGSSEQKVEPAISVSEEILTDTDGWLDR